MRKIPCPYCDEKVEVLAEQNGRAVSSTTLFPRMQNILIAVTDLLAVFTGGAKRVTKKKALDDKCKACGGSGQIEDVTDTSEQDKAAAAYLEGKSQRILELERKLGNSTGGNKVERIAGACAIIVGRTMNNAKSYTVHEGKGAAPASGYVGKEGRASVRQGAPAAEGKGSNVVTNNNVPANTGGGVMYIQCGNKFKLATGAQGIEINSHGPISINGGMMQFSGAEVSIGSKVGTTLIEGDDLQLKGKRVSLTPSGEEGFINIDGSIATSGNLQAGAGYVDNLYFSNATCPEKQETTKISSQTDYQTGPAIWGGTSGGKLPVVATQNMVKWILDSATDVTLAGAMNPFNPRSILKNADNITSMLYSMLPLEARPTGVCVIVAGTPTSIGGIGLIFNFPHEHAMPDEAHSHNVTVPAINYKGQTAESVRAEFAAAGGNSRIPAGAAGAQGDIFAKGAAAAVAAAVNVYEAGKDLFTYGKAIS
jgi:hypothetical protein